MLQGLIVNNVLVPLLLGVAVALTLALANKTVAVKGYLVAGVAIVAVYVLLEGMPSFPPAAVKQKLVYAFAASAVLVIVIEWAPRWHAALLTGMAGIFALACVLWFAGPIVSRAADIGAVMAPLAYTALASLAALWLLMARGSNPPPPTRRALVRLSALLSFCIGSAVIAAFGGFIGMGQIFGGLAALSGGIVLVGYGAMLRGNEALALRLDGVVPALLLPALATGILVAFYATSLDVFAYTLMPLTMAAGAILLRTSRLDDLPGAVAPIAQGAIVALPSLLAILVAILP